METEKDIIAEWLNQGQMLIGAEAFDEADKYFDKILAKSPMHAEAYVYKGLVKANRGALDEAKEMLNKALMINKNYAEAWFHLGNIAFMQDSFSEGVKCFNKSIALGYSHPDVYFHLGLMYEDREDFNEAIRCYNKAIAMDELNTTYRIRKASLHLATGRYEEAIQSLNELRMIAPDNFDSYHLLSAAYTMQGQFDDAQRILEDARRRFPDDIDILFDRLRVLAAKGDLDGALKLVDDAEHLSLNEEGQRELLLNKGKLLGQQEKIDEAITCFERALSTGGDLENDPEDGEILYFLMNAYLARQNYEKLLEYAFRAEKAGDSDPYVLCAKYYIAAAYKNLNKNNSVEKYKDAIRYYRQISMENPERIDAYLFRAMCHRDLKEYDKALELTDYVGILQPENGNIQLIKGNILKEKGDIRGAKSAYQKAKKLGASIPDGEV